MTWQIGSQLSLCVMAACCWVLRCLRAHAAMCALGIDELREHPAEILRGRHTEDDAFRAHVSVKRLYVGDSEPQFDLSSRVLFGSRVDGCGSKRCMGRTEFQT